MQVLCAYTSSTQVGVFLSAQTDIQTMGASSPPSFDSFPLPIVSPLVSPPITQAVSRRSPVEESISQGSPSVRASSSNALSITSLRVGMQTSSTRSARSFRQRQELLAQAYL